MSIDRIGAPKNPGEIKQYSVDFTDGLDLGDTIASHDIDVYESGTDTDTTSTMFVGASSGVSGNTVYAKFQAGEDGKRYNLRFSVTTTGGETMYHFMVLTVKDERV